MQQTEIDFEQARARGRAGADRAARHAEDESPGWLETAAEAVRQYARDTYPQGFIIEEARAAVEHKVARPPDMRSWGAVTRLCKARGYIEPKPGQWRAACSSNGAPKQVYGRGRNA